MSQDIIGRLAALPTAALSDAMRRNGFDPNTMHSSMKPVWAGAETCGPAFTVRTYPGATHGCDLALKKSKPGDVLIIAAGGYTEVIMWGEIFSTTARELGLGGTVIDGSARDIAGIRKTGYPVFARGITPRGGTFDDSQSETQVPVNCAGVVVHPGDFVRGDEVGVVVVPASAAEEILGYAEAIAQKEARMLELALAGTPMAEVRKTIAKEGL